MAVRNDSSSSTKNAAAAAAAEAARQRAAAEAKARAAEAAKAAAAAAAKKAAADAAKTKPKDGFKNDASKKVALDGKPTAANAADIQKAKADAPAVSDKLPKNPDDLPKMFPELKGADKETVKKAYDALNKLATGNESEKLKAMGDLFKQFPTTLGNVLDKMGVKDNKLVKIATNKDALGALSTLVDDKKGVADKAQATLKLAKAVGDTIAPKDLEGVLKTTLGALPAAEKLISTVTTWADPKKTGLEKAKATLDMAGALKDFAGKEFPKLANDLRSLDGPLKAAGAALTLMDPKASTTDKITAGAQLAAEIPDLGKNLSDFKELLTKAGVKDAEKIAEGATRAADVAVKGLDPKLAKSLTEAETASLKQLAEKVGADKLEPILKNITDKSALQGLEKQLTNLEPAAGKRLLTTLGSLENSVLEKTLKSPELAESFGKLATKLDDEGAKVVGKMVKEFDQDALKTLAKFTDNLSGDALKDGLKLLGPALDKGGSKVVAQGLKVMEHVLGKMGVKITGEVAAKALKNLVKVIPVAGAIPNAIDAVKYGKEAIELRDKNKDLGMLAMNAAKLNVLDGAAGLIMDATGVGVAVDVAVSVGFSAAELALDIGFEQEKAKMLADPQNYKAPDWVKAVNLGAAALQGPQGMVELAAYYGPEGAAELVQWGVEKGVKGAIDVAKFAGVETAKAVGDDLKMKGQMLHALADVVRNPGKYGKAVADAAINTYNSVIEKGGELAEAAKKQLGEIVDEAKKLGTKGLETMKWIAQNPGPAAKMAIEGIKGAVNTAIDAGTDAAKALAKKGLETLKDLHTGYENLKGAAKEKAKELLTAAKDGIRAGIDKAVALGEKGVDLVVWAANNPGAVWEGAKTAVKDVLQKGGALAEKTWNEVVALGSKGLDLAKDAVNALKNGGEKAVETLKYVIQNPGEAAGKVREWAADSLKSLVTAGGAAAKKAAGAVKEFIENRAEWAQKLGRDLLKQGSEAFLEVAKAWKDNLTEGGKAFMDGLKDLGSAGAEQLQKLAQFGGQLAGAAVDRLKSMANSGVEAAKSALGALADFGGEVGRLASNGYNAVKSATNGEFSVGGYKIDLNPLW
ncbi:MAG: Dauer Up-regulated [Archangium sp.]|nr:Dauer Up-regulated [Archangium sp.]